MLQDYQNCFFFVFSFCLPTLYISSIPQKSCYFPITKTKMKAKLWFLYGIQTKSLSHPGRSKQIDKKGLKRHIYHALINYD